MAEDNKNDLFAPPSQEEMDMELFAPPTEAELQAPEQRSETERITRGVGTGATIAAAQKGAGEILNRAGIPDKIKTAAKEAGLAF